MCSAMARLPVRPSTLVLSIACVVLFIVAVVSCAAGGSGSSVTPTGACTGQFVESLPQSNATTSSEVVVELMSLPACRGLTPDQQREVLSGLTTFAQRME